MNKELSNKFRKILNDLKRRPEDASKDLNIDLSKINKILDSDEDVSFDIISKAVEVWPVNYSDFFSKYNDTDQGFKIMKKSESNLSSRKMKRNGEDYYLYKDTVMSKLSPFRPEWIEELSIVENDDPENKKVCFNNGHFLHQFTYFVGPVNFYYIENNLKKIAKMNTGDSMYISPYIPHTFATRKNKDNILGHILALTFTDKIDVDHIDELSNISYEEVLSLKVNLDHRNKSFVSSLEKHLDLLSMPIDTFEKSVGIDLKTIKEGNKLPEVETMEKIASFLKIDLRDLIFPEKKSEVYLKKYKDGNSWEVKDDKNLYYKIIMLTNIPQVSSFRAIELEILNQDNFKELIVPAHQYIYNLNADCIIKVNDKKITFKPGDSIYLTPGKKHAFTGNGKLLILRLNGKVSGDSDAQLSMLSDDNIKRLINDNQPWFN